MLNFPGTTELTPDGFEYYRSGDISSCESMKVPTSLIKKVESASLELGKFSFFVENAPNREILLNTFGRVEATYSSLFEGIEVDILDAFKDKNLIDKDHRDDWDELHAYIAANELALKGLPLGIPQLTLVHKRLLEHNRGQDKSPGEFRRYQNLIRGNRPENARFVPPLHGMVPKLMCQLEKFMQDDTSRLPHLIRIALIHYQFETIQPVNYDNGRIGRMLVLLYLTQKKLLSRPALHISKYFEANRNEYFVALDLARSSKDGLINWISFFLDAVLWTAKDGIKQVQTLAELRAQLLKVEIASLKRRESKGIAMLDFLFMHPVVTTKTLQQELDFSASLTQLLIGLFEDLQIIKEITGQKRNRTFVFQKYIDVLERKL